MNRNLLVFAAVAAAAAVGFIAFASSEQAVALPGITTKDAYPNGCVSCHANLGAGKDKRLNVSLAKVKAHPKLTAVATVPKDCAKCHKAGTKVEALDTLMHKVHYRELEKSDFVKNFQGACLSCHSLDPKTGKNTVKTGAKNW